MLVLAGEGREGGIESSTCSRRAPKKALVAKKSSTMLVQAHTGEAQAARSLWGGGDPGKKGHKVLVPARGGAVLTASRTQRGLQETKI